MEFILDFTYDRSVVELYNESLQNTFTNEGRTSGRKWNLDQVEQRLKEASKTRSKNGFDLLGILKIKVDGKLAAICFPRELIGSEYGKYELNPINTYYRLSGIYVSDEFRGQGIALKVLNWFIEERKYVLWTADTNNRSSLRVAEKAGLIKTAEIPVYNNNDEHIYDIISYINK